MERRTKRPRYLDKQKSAALSGTSGSCRQEQTSMGATTGTAQTEPGSSSERTTERIATRRLRLEQRAEHLGPPFLKVDVALQSAFQQSLDPLQRFRPCQRGLKGGDGVEEPVGGR